MSLSQPVIVRDSVLVTHSSLDRNEDALLYGSAIEGLAFLALATLVTINTSASVHEPGPSMSSLPRDKTWPHSDPAIWTMTALAIATLLILPVAIGFLSRSWPWILICPVMLPILSFVGSILGDWLHKELSIAETTDSWAELDLVVFWILTPILCLLPAILGTILGKFIHWRNAKQARRPASSTTA